MELGDDMELSVKIRGFARCGRTSREPAQVGGGFGPAVSVTLPLRDVGGDETRRTVCDAFGVNGSAALELGGERPDVAPGNIWPNVGKGLKAKRIIGRGLAYDIVDAKAAKAED